MDVENVFKRYDIRGLYPQEINEDFAFRLGIAFGKYVKDKSRHIVVGSDLRDSTPYLKNRFIKGVQSQGIMVYDVGVAPTDLVAFMSKKYVFGVMITASHNSFSTNGFKFVFKSLPFTNEMLEEVKDIFRKMNREDVEKAMHTITSFKKFETPYKEIHYIAYRDYANTLIKVLLNNNYDILSEAHFFVKNSSLMPVLKYIQRNIYANFMVESNGYVIDPTLPSEPTKELIESIASSTSKEVVFVFDPDADRVLIYDKKYGFIDGNYVIASMALAMRFKRITTSIDFSEILTNILKKRGIEVHKTRVGDVFVSNEAYKNKSMFFGEPNNHTGLSSISYYHSGVGTAFAYMFYREEILEVLKSLPSLYFETLKIKEEIDVQRLFPQSKVISKVDGIKLSLNDKTYILIRKSGTENTFKVYVESANEKDLNRVKNSIIEMVEKQ